MDISCGDDKPYITDQELDKNHRLACEETLKFFENSKKDCVEYWHEVLENVLDNLAVGFVT
jgi:hypothetical protein